jgi:hypothetical protein
VLLWLAGYAQYSSEGCVLLGRDSKQGLTECLHVRYMHRSRCMVCWLRNSSLFETACKLTVCREAPGYCMSCPVISMLSSRMQDTGCSHDLSHLAQSTARPQHALSLTTSSANLLYPFAAGSISTCSCWTTVWSMTERMEQMEGHWSIAQSLQLSSDKLSSKRQPWSVKQA